MNILNKPDLSKFYQVLPLDEIKTDSSTIIKIIDKNKKNFSEINEIYSTTIKKDVIRAWKKHTEMTCNIFVIKGLIKFLFYDDCFKVYEEIILKENKKEILEIKPNIWFGFKGFHEENTLINFSNIIHDEKEILKKKYNAKHRVF